ncbi:plastocyanin [Dechloromonas sp. TW-R-39-2]|nr:plastocyanin [Dechloromonas sp. TW-R-39-2]
MPSGVARTTGRLFLERAPAMLVLVCFSALGQTTFQATMEHYRFDPAELHIKVGDTVRWTNHEKRTSHSVLFPAEGGLESDRLFPDESWSRQFTQPGRHEYRCGPHPEMKGVVFVE